MTSLTAGPLPEPQPTFALAENQYRFGTGPILVRGVRILAELTVDDETWVHVRADVAEGTRLRHSGWTERELYVPASMMPAIGGRRWPS